LGLIGSNQTSGRVIVQPPGAQAGAVGVEPPQRLPGIQI